MLIPNQLIEVKWGRTNKSHYENLGYVFTSFGDLLQVKPEDLPITSKAIVYVQCDKCGKISTTTYQSYLKSLELHPNKYFCKKCVQLLKSTQDKISSTIKEKYGTQYYFQSQDCKEKTKDTNLQKLGVEFPMQSDIVKAKVKQSYQNNGTTMGFQSLKSREKARATLANKNLIPTSKQQLELYEKLKELYTCELNKPCSTLNFDIALLIDGIWIDIEVDGEYWHQDKNKDRKRDEFVKSQGYKILRIRINRKLPDFNIIQEAINNLITSEHSFYQIAADDVRQ